MSLKLEIYFPKETVENLTNLESIILDIGDLLAQNYGSVQTEEKFDLEDLKSFIIIRDGNVPVPESLEQEDCYLVIPIEEEKSE